MPIEGVQLKGLNPADIQRIEAANNTRPSGVTLTGTPSLALPTPVGEGTRSASKPVSAQDQANANLLSRGQIASAPSVFNTVIKGDRRMFKSLLHYILIKVINEEATEQAQTAIAAQSFVIAGLSKYVKTSAIPESFNTCYLYELGVTSRDEEGVVKNGDGVGEGPSETFFAYIKLGLFVEILNNVVLRDRTVPIFSFNTAGDSTTFDVEFYKGNRFATHKDHVSVDPAVCLLPRNNHFGGDETGNRIYDIYLSIDFLVRTLDTLTLDNPEVDLVTYLESILANIERVTGNFNEYQIQYYEESYSFSIVDRKYMQRTSSANIPQINVIGVGSVVKSFNLTSLLSPQISKMVAIGSQVSGTDLGLEATAFKKLNEGLRDSIVKTRAVGDLSKEDTEAERIKRNQLLLERLNEYLTRLYQDGLYVPDDVENIVLDYTTYSKEILGEEDRPEYNFILPFELTMVLEGISGFRIMESFKINPQVLPKMYLDKTAQRVAFIVTGLEQKVSKAGWDTIVKGQMYLLPSGTIAGDSTANILKERSDSQKRRTSGRTAGATGKNGRYTEDELELIGIGNHKLLKGGPASDFKLMYEAAKKEGVEIVISDSYRTFQVQTDIFDWDLYVQTGGSRTDTSATPGASRKKRGSNGQTAVAFPGTSNHGEGKAIDVTGKAVQDWIKKNGYKYNWSWYEGKAVNENWHFTWTTDTTKLKDWTT
jgi:hypothetical protein